MARDTGILADRAITALFALSNRYANFAGIMPNTEFYAMAR